MVPKIHMDSSQVNNISLQQAQYGGIISSLTITTPLVIIPKLAGVVKLVDALDSKSSARKGMPVRPRPPAP